LLIVDRFLCEKTPDLMVAAKRGWNRERPTQFTRCPELKYADLATTASLVKMMDLWKGDDIENDEGEPSEEGMRLLEALKQSGPMNPQLASPVIALATPPPPRKMQWEPAAGAIVDSTRLAQRQNLNINGNKLDCWEVFGR
jgi:hypothetical protein